MRGLGRDIPQAAQVSGPDCASVSADCVWLIGLSERAQVLFAQLQIESTCGALQMFDFGGADYRGGYTRILQQPGESDFRWRSAELFRDSAAGFDHLRVRG